MPDLDLEPHDYTDHGKREPLLHPRWKVGLAAIVLVFLLALFIRYVYSPAAHGVFDWIEAGLSARR
jgi:hypothetical protein